MTVQFRKYDSQTHTPNKKKKITGWLVYKTGGSRTVLGLVFQKIGPKELNEKVNRNFRPEN
jgi:hypothetical protein